MEAVLGDGEAICGTEHGEACLENEREISVWRVVCVCGGGLVSIAHSHGGSRQGSPW